MKRLILLYLACCSFLLPVYSQANSKPFAPIKGVNFVAPRNPITQQDMQPIKELAANYLGIVPYAFAYKDQPQIVFDTSRQWWGEKIEGVITTVKYAQNLGLKVMIKPHVWVFGQGWPGDFNLTSEALWRAWESQYREYVLAFAQVAEDLNVEIYCIGTEYRHASTLRRNFWVRLIADVRKIYHGQLTYAANWDNYHNIQFWNYLDFIGIDAYFPLAEPSNPSRKQLEAAWSQYKKVLEQHSLLWNKPILFTEYGYQSVDHGTGSHWEIESDTKKVNLELQNRAYEVVFEQVFTQPWFAGGFLWKWHAHHYKAGGSTNKSWTPQNKPAQETIQKYYRQ